MIALDPKGNFLDVKVISHHEPAFLDGLGEAPMFQFVMGSAKAISLAAQLDNIDVLLVDKRGKTWATPGLRTSRT